MNPGTSPVRDRLDFLRLLPLIVVVYFALLKVPLDSNFMLAERFQCEILPPAMHINMILLNTPHLIAFFGLYLIAAAAFRRDRYTRAALCVLLVSIMIEIEQCLYMEGNCQVHDMVSNVIAIAMGAGVWLLIDCMAKRYRLRF